jgi:hypothetical protein
MSYIAKQGNEFPSLTWHGKNFEIIAPKETVALFSKYININENAIITIDVRNFFIKAFIFRVYPSSFDTLNLQ